MTIIIQKNISELDSLSKKAQLVIELIPEGERWFELSSQQESPSFHFDSEVELLVAILEGLHSSSLLYIPMISLLVDPEKLMEVDIGKLQQIVDVIQQVKTADNIQESTLKGTGLVSNTTLKKEASTLLEACSLSENSLFQVMKLSDYIAISTLTKELGVTPDVLGFLDIKAANYAVSVAQTVLEFCDFYRFYMEIVQQLELAKSPTTVRNKVDAVYKSLAPLAHRSLLCPQISGSIDAAQINQSIQTWMEYGNQFGFSSFSTAMLQIVKNISLTSLEQQQLDVELDGYMQNIEKYFGDNQLQEPVLSQDGKTLSYQGEGSEDDVSLSLNQQGCLAIEKFIFKKIN